MDDAVLYEAEGAIVTLTLNRPDKRNPVSERDVVEGLISALGRIQADASVRAARGYRPIPTIARKMSRGGPKTCNLLSGSGMVCVTRVGMRRNSCSCRLGHDCFVDAIAKRG